MRSLAREAVYKYLFSRLFNPCDEGLFDVLIKELNDDDKNFATTIKDAVINNEEKYNQILSEMSVGYKFDRIFKSDRCAILIGMAEYDLFANKTPMIVIIDEAVKLSAKYSTDNSPDFVNGILANYCK